MRFGLGCRAGRRAVLLVMALVVVVLVVMGRPGCGWCCLVARLGLRRMWVVVRRRCCRGRRRGRGRLVRVRRRWACRRRFPRRGFRGCLVWWCGFVHRR